MTLRRVVTALTVIGLLFTTAATSRAIDQQGNVFLSADVTYGNFSWKFRIDPLSVQEFKLDVQFDPSRAEFADIVYLNGFTEVTPPDLSGLPNGFLSDLQGIFQGPGLPPLGEVDVVDVYFQDLLQEPDSADKVPFRVFASEGDFVRGLDETGETRWYGPGQPDGEIIEAIGFVPEPASLALCGTGILALLGYCWGRRRALR
jgi:hypothetical protein